MAWIASSSYLPLNAKHRSKRLRYATENAERNWENVICSAEKVLPGGEIIWGWIRREGVGEVGLMSQGGTVEYIHMLEDKLATSVLKNVCFLQNNHALRSTRSIQNWFANQQIELLLLPPKSPELNPAGSVLDFITKDLETMHPCLLASKLLKNWESFQGLKVRFHGLYANIPIQLHKIISHNGGYTFL